MQNLTELRLKLADIQSKIDPLQADIDECVEFIDLLTGGSAGVSPRKKASSAKAKTNGSAGKAISPEVFKRQVREHYTAARARRAKKATKQKPLRPMANPEQALELARRRYPNIPDPSHDTMTAQEAAQYIGMSDSGVRLLYHAGKLPNPTRELRRFGRSGRFHPAMVIPRSAVEAYKAQSGDEAPAAPAHRSAKGNGTAKPSEYKSVMKERRERSARLLAHFDRTEPRQIPPDYGPTGISVLVQHKYLKPKAGGYVRTAREFTV